MRLITILDTDNGGRIKFAMQATVPASRQLFYANPNAKSAYNAASAGEITALQNGSVVESIGILQVDGLTLTQIKQSLATTQSNFQNFINNNNPWARYGTSFDGTTWTSLTVN